MSKPQNSNVMEREGTGQMSISLHPLVLVNISDHWTRNKVQQNKENPRVIGALLGVQTGRNIEIFNSFELVFSVVSGAIVIDTAFLLKKQEQFRKVFPTYDFLGWYSTGEKVLESDIEVHKQIMDANENPLFLLLDAASCLRPSTKDLPISIYESELHVIQEKPTLMFVKIPYKIETGEAERIAVDHVARVTPSGGGDGSALGAQLMHTHNAVNMLTMRIKIIQQYVEAVKAGKTPKDHAILRRISSLTNQLPAIDTANFKQDFINEYNDALLITYLATITKSTNNVNDLLEKFSIVNDRQTRRRGFF